MLEFNATFIAAMFSFVVFIFVMNAIFYEPVLSVLKKRDDYIAGEYADAEKYNLLSKEISEEMSQKIQAAKTDADEYVKTAVNSAKIKSDVMTKDLISTINADYKNKKENLYQQKKLVEADIKNSIEESLSKDIFSVLLRL